MGVLWWIDLESVIFQTTIDLIHVLLALLGEANMKGARILYFLPMSGLHQCQHHAIVVEKDRKAFARPDSLAAPQTKVGFEEVRRRWYGGE